MATGVSVIIPAHNAGRHIRLCLSALFAGSELPDEIIVVDDGSWDDTAMVASEFAVGLCRIDSRRGPAFARNEGARAARGDILLFLDADVCVGRDTIGRFRQAFEKDVELDALFGSYDTTPQSPELLSQYRNLLHAWVHQSGSERASTFWSGCGAIRRALFLEHSGFSERIGRPAIEDIELGYRLNRAGCRIALDREIQVTHLKRWTFRNLVKTDILDRGIPWTELILRDRYMPNDLNLHLSQRVSVAVVFILVALSCFTAISGGGYILIPLFTVMFAMLARWWIEFSAPHTPRTASAVLVAIMTVIAFLAWRHGMYGIIPPLAISPVLLIVRHRYSPTGKRRKLLRFLAIVYICSSLCAAALYFPANRFVFLCFGLLALLGVMNSQFYIFLAANRGVPFMLASIPFHLLYHFYNGFSFIAGAIRYGWTRFASANASGEPVSGSSPVAKPERVLLNAP